MTARLLIDACGLSQREAAEFLSVRLDTVKSWYRASPTAARPGIIHELQALNAKQRRAAANFINLTRNLAREGTISDTIEVGIASDDAEARSLGWPCVGAQRMAIAIAAARIKNFRIITVPRGRAARNREHRQRLMPRHISASHETKTGGFGMIETEIERLLNDTYAAARNRGLPPDKAWNEREELAKLFSTGADVFSGRENEDGAKKNS